MTLGWSALVLLIYHLAAASTSTLSSKKMYTHGVTKLPSVKVVLSAKSYLLQNPLTTVLKYDLKHLFIVLQKFYLKKTRSILAKYAGRGNLFDLGNRYHERSVAISVLKK